MKYEEILPISRDEAEASFASGDIEKLCYAMISIAFYDEDWKWAQDKCLEFFFSPNDRISSLAATCLSHIARFHRKLEKRKVLKALKTRKNDPEIGGFIDDAITEIKYFVKDGFFSRWVRKK